MLCGLGGEGRCCLFELRREEQDAAISVKSWRQRAVQGQRPGVGNELAVFVELKSRIAGA